QSERQAKLSVPSDTHTVMSNSCRYNQPRPQRIARHPMSRRIAAVSLLALIVGCVGDQATPASEGTSSATSETTSTSTTASTSTTEFAEFDQEEADRLLEERFGTTTTTAEAA